MCFLYSRGERKIWYGVSGDEGEQFDRVMMELVPYLFERQPDVLHHMTTTMNPQILMSKVRCITFNNAHALFFGNFEMKFRKEEQYCLIFFINYSRFIKI